MILSYENIQDATYILGILPWYMYLSSAYAAHTYLHMLQSLRCFLK